MGLRDDGLVATGRKLLLMQYPWMFEICLLAFCLGASMRVRPNPQHSWLHHLVLVFLTGFAGGTIIPMFFGRPPAIFVNDVIVPLVCLSWYAVHFTRAGRWLQTSAGKYVLVCLFEVYRAASILKTVAQVATDIPPGPYYPIPIVGPILIGTLSGCLGAFMPPDRGISFIQAGMPLNLQTTLLACAFYHLAAHDPGLVGAYLRGLPVLHLSDPENLKATVVLFFVGMALLSLIKGPDFNPFTPIHNLCYVLLGLPLAPATEERLKAQRAAAQQQTPTRRPTATAPTTGGSVLTRPKVLVPLLAVLYYQIRQRVPRTSLAAGGRLHPGEFIQACGLLDGKAACTPQYLALDNEGKLALFKGSGPGDAGSERVWTAKPSRRPGKLSEAGFFAELDPATGALLLKHANDESNAAFWSSKAVAAKGGDAKAGNKRVKVRVLKDRPAFGVFDGDTPLWVSDQ